MTDLEKLRAFAQGLLEERDHMVAEVGIAASGREVERAQVAHELLQLLDALPPPTSPDRIPTAIRAGLDRYATGGIRTGRCLQSILAGDLFGAFARADAETMLAMPAIVAYIESQLPAGCHGSEEIVERWIARPRS